MCEYRGVAFVLPELLMTKITILITNASIGLKKCVPQEFDNLVAEVSADLIDLPTRQ